MKRAVKDATKMDNMPKSRTFQRCMTYSRGPSVQISLHSDQIIPEREREREGKGIVQLELAFPERTHTRGCKWIIEMYL